MIIGGRKRKYSVPLFRNNICFVAYFVEIYHEDYYLEIQVGKVVKKYLAVANINKDISPSWKDEMLS